MDQKILGKHPTYEYMPELRKKSSVRCVKTEAYPIFHQKPWLCFKVLFFKRASDQFLQMLQTQKDKRENKEQS